MMSEDDDDSEDELTEDNHFKHFLDFGRFMGKLCKLQCHFCFIGFNVTAAR